MPGLGAEVFVRSLITRRSGVLSRLPHFVIAGPDPAIQKRCGSKPLDARIKSGHDGFGGGRRRRMPGPGPGGASEAFKQASGARSQFSQIHIADAVIVTLAQDEVGALACGQHIAMEISEVDRGPDLIRRLYRFFFRQL